MKATAPKYGSVSERLAGVMTRAQALRLRGLAEEAYQPEQSRRTCALMKPRAEIAISVGHEWGPKSIPLRSLLPIRQQRVQKSPGLRPVSPTE